MAITGGCHCGAISYEVEGEALTHALCHCTDCRRHAGAPMVGWTMYPLDAVKVTRGEPKVYQSSEHGRRHFCPNCGTGLFYMNGHVMPGIIDMMIRTPFRRGRTSRSPTALSGWSAHTNYLRSSAIRRENNPVAKCRRS
jgi:hypothetical protein